MTLGFKYSMVSEVIEFDNDRRIAWQTRPPHVRESWDVSQERIQAFVRPARKKTCKAMELTLGRIGELVA